jgi:hypothetical protein
MAYQITNSIWLGTRAALQPGFFKAMGVTRVISLCPVNDGEKGLLPKETTWIDLSCDDCPETNIIEIGQECHQHLVDEVPTLLHCEQGRSRSVSSLLVHLMLSRKESLGPCLKFLTERYPKVDPNLGFIGQLESYSVMLNGPDLSDPIKTGFSSW